MRLTKEERMTQAELDFIKQNWPANNDLEKVDWIVSRLKFYSRRRVLSEAKRMGLYTSPLLRPVATRDAPNQNVPWTASDDQALIDCLRYGMDNDKIARFLGRSARAVHSRKCHLKRTGRI